MAVEDRIMDVDRSATAGNFARWAPLAVVIAAALLAYAFGLHRYLTLETIVERHGALRQLVERGYVPALAVYGLIYVAVTALSLPGAAILTIAGGFLFGWAAATAVTVIAATVGASVVFLVARSSFGDVLTRRAGPLLRKIADGFSEDAFHYLLFLRLVPLFPFWLVNIAPALVAVRLKTFVAATFIGIIPGTLAFAVLGSGFDSVIAAQTRTYNACLAAKPAAQCMLSYHPGALLTPQIVAAFAALGIVALLPVAMKRLRARKHGS
jgi:uncharacterized membrane protein YdjX (TVP38/TMEM64 family)